MMSSIDSPAMKYDFSVFALPFPIAAMFKTQPRCQHVIHYDNRNEGIIHVYPALPLTNVLGILDVYRQQKHEPWYPINGCVWKARWTTGA